MKIGIDIDGVIIDYERVLKTYGELYSYIELNKRKLINPNEQYLTDIVSHSIFFFCYYIF